MPKITLGGIIGHRVDLTMKKKLFALDVEGEFLKPFIEKDTGTGYIGLGKLLDALVNLSNYSNNTKAKSLKRLIIDTIDKAQLPSGYIGMYKKEARIIKLWDIHETSYLIYALVQDYCFFGNKRSLEIAKKAMNYILEHLTEDTITKIYSFQSGKTRTNVDLGTIGFEGALIALYKATDGDVYLEAAKNLFKLSDWHRAIELGRHDGVGGHAYAYFSRCLAQLELYQIDGDKKWLKQTTKVLDFLLKEGGLVASGTCGVDECWHNSQQGSGNLGETCATAYLIFLLDKLLQIKYCAKYGDLMERSIYNALFAAQSEDGRNIRYYVPFSGERTYFEKDTYCCPNNYRRVIFRLYNMIYYHSASGIIVNLYTQSKAEINLPSGNTLKIQQQTAYPYSDKITIELIPSEVEKFPVRLRIPAWCEAFDLHVNSKKIDLHREKNIICIKRLWSAGDKIYLKLKMPCRQLKGFFEQENKVALIKGPILFTLNLNLNKTLKAKEIPLVVITPEKGLKVTNRQNLTKPDILVCEVETEQHNKVLLSEFTDPDGIESYFQTSDMDSAKNDELLDHESLKKISYTKYSNSTDWGGQ
jgi:uncharacterized protein